MKLEINRETSQGFYTQIASIKCDRNDPVTTIIVIKASDFEESNLREYMMESIRLKLSLHKFPDLFLKLPHILLLCVVQLSNLLNVAGSE